MLRARPSPSSAGCWSLPASLSARAGSDRCSDGRRFDSSPHAACREALRADSCMKTIIPERGVLFVLLRKFPAWRSALLYWATELEYATLRLLIILYHALCGGRACACCVSEAACACAQAYRAVDNSISAASLLLLRHAAGEPGP